MVTNWIADTTNSPFELKTAITNWQKIFDTGYIDLGNHSQTHEFAYDNPSSYTQSQLETDITASHDTLRNYFPNQSVITFASPWGRQPENAINEMKKAHYANRAAGGDIVPGKTPANFFAIPTIAVQYETPLAILNKRVDDAINSGGWNTELYHGIGTSGYATNIATMEEHLKYINSKSEDVWAGSFTEVVKYIYERDNAKAVKLWATDSSIGIKVTDSLDDELFDYPLTVKVNLPAAWSGNVKCVQNRTIKTVKTFNEGGKTYAYVNVIPDGGNVIISK